MGISKRRAWASEGGWPSQGLSCFLPIPVLRKNSKSLKKSLYPIFVELGRRAWVWEAYLRGGGIILVPDILLQKICNSSLKFSALFTVAAESLLI